MPKPSIFHGDCREVMAKLIAEGAQFDSCCTDPPYHLTSIVKRFGGKNAAPAQEGTDGAFRRASTGFMGKTWDGGDIAFDPAMWRLVYDLLKPGGYLLAFSGTRTQHRMVCAIEDAGFEIRDQIGWMYGSGFPKSHDVSKAIDKAAGKEGSFGEPKSDAHADWIKRGRMRGDDGEDGWQRPWMDNENAVDRAARTYIPTTREAAQWQGWGTALKPAWEPICVARKPLIGTVAENVMAHGTGALNIDGCRVGSDGGTSKTKSADKSQTSSVGGFLNAKAGSPINAGRWPANVIHDGSDEVLAAFPDSAGGGFPKSVIPNNPINFTTAESRESRINMLDVGSAARFFYSAKADKSDRLTSKHPTVKPVDLMAYLCRLVTQPGGHVLEPFGGSGSTGMACMREGFDCTIIEQDAEYVKDIRARLDHVDGGDLPMFAATRAEQGSLLE